MRLLNVWVFTLVGGLLFAGLMVYTTPETLKKREVAEHGRLVPVQVMRLAQVHLGKTHSYYLHFRYQNHTRSIRVARNELEEARTGRLTSLRHLDQYPDLFLPPNETMRFEFVPRVLLFLFGVYAAIYSVKKLREPE